MGLKIFILLSLVALSVASTYDGYKVYLATPQTYEQIDLLHTLESELNLDFWEALVRVQTNRSYRIMVEPENLAAFEAELTNQGVPHSILIDNVGDMIENEKVRNNRAKSQGRADLDFTHFWDYAEISSYLERIAAQYPQTVKLEILGKSYEGRNVYAVQISQAGAVDDSRPIAIIEGTLHAREWIGTMVSMHLISELVENSAANGAFLDGIDWVIVPIVNVDGFAYTFSADRLWRKTRSSIAGSTCLGVDPNRNFKYQWEVKSGTSTNPCALTWPGSVAESEIEVQYLSRLLDRYQNTKLFLAVHSYGNYLLYPWSYARTSISNSADHQEVGVRVRTAINAVAGNYYTLGPSGSTLYLASGISVDYAAGVAGIPISFTIELPGGGRNGFDIEPERIVPVITETFPGLRVFAQFIRERFVN
jgi:hypothetical protein